MSTIGERIREERERKGLNQTDFGRIGGVTKKTQGNYEANIRAPAASYLAAIAEEGVDVLYILLDKHGYAVNENGVSYLQAVDEAILGKVLAAIEGELDRAGQSLPPTAKGVMVAKLYRQAVSIPPGEEQDRTIRHGAEFVSGLFEEHPGFTEGDDK